MLGYFYFNKSFSSKNIYLNAFFTVMKNKLIKKILQFKMFFFVYT